MAHSLEAKVQQQEISMAAEADRLAAATSQVASLKAEVQALERRAEDAARECGALDAEAAAARQRQVGPSV